MAARVNRESRPAAPLAQRRNRRRRHDIRSARARRLARRRRTVVVSLLFIAAVLVVADLVRNGGRDVSTEVRALQPPAAPPVAAAPAPLPSPSGTPEVPEDGPGTFGYAPGPGPVLGWAGPVRSFRVAVEDGTGQVVAAFAAAVDAILGDPRSWIAGRTLRLQRVVADAEFTIYLATPATSERMCAAGGLQTERYTSCRLGGRVIINLARWLLAIPGYGAPLAEYQAYAMNHEVGHQLGYGHEACPAPGRPAPVMQQQTLGLRGCTAFGWPYRDGRRYSGSPVA